MKVAEQLKQESTPGSPFSLAARWPRLHRCGPLHQNSHPGFQPHRPTSRPGQRRAKRNNALGIRGSVRHRRGKRTCQWEDPIWQEATEGVPLYYNLHRWLEYGSGRLTSTDHEYYYRAASLVSLKPLARPAGVPDSFFAIKGEPFRPRAPGSQGTEIAASVLAKTVCDGCDGIMWVWASDARPVCARRCFVAHEEDHLDWFRTFRPDACTNRREGANPAQLPNDSNLTECRAFGVSFRCLERQCRLSSVRGGTTAECRSFLNRNSNLHSKQFGSFCAQAIINTPLVFR